ncbi:anti-sigma factor [Microscilla marina]|uniref:Uncharacterized protein n=1 Tax=Microscilla marina ATCC 23134 TaxID=313606 RepID=A1ZZR6_MICM2|nr:hypothetical protein [Microscilla marina]EAY24124.1 hypothetical protein M23134_06041 [Microscilla marina ATCC 23134]
MINQTNRELLIQQYIEGSLSEQDTKKFEALLKRDTTLRNDVALQQEINTHIEAAFVMQDLDDLLDEVVKDNKDFIKKTAKDTFKQSKRTKGFKNLIILFIAAGALLSGGVWLSARHQHTAAKASELATLPQHSIAEETLLLRAKLPEGRSTSQPGKESQEKPVVEKQASSKTPPGKTLKAPPALSPLRSQLDSLPEIVTEQGMGFGKAAGVRTTYRPVYFYNRLPDANKDHAEVYYQFRDTLRVYGQVTQRSRLFLLFRPQQGEYYMVTPKDTIPLAYKERKIQPLKK